MATPNNIERATGHLAPLDKSLPATPGQTVEQLASTKCLMDTMPTTHMAINAKMTPSEMAKFELKLEHNQQAATPYLDKDKASFKLSQFKELMSGDTVGGSSAAADSYQKIQEAYTVGDVNKAQFTQLNAKETQITTKDAVAPTSIHIPDIFLSPDGSTTGG
jgi:hypothetical protein